MKLRIALALTVDRYLAGNNSVYVSRAPLQ
jgi:hypothetical protein